MSTPPLNREPEKGDNPQIPQHVAVIMDGNGRWAKRRGKPRTEGHRAGAIAAREIVEHSARLGLKQLTLYSFSIENWSRPVNEVNTLMRLYIEYLISERPVMLKNNIRFRQIGRRDGLPPDVLEELDRTIAALDHNTGMTLCLAVNYGSRAEITDAARSIARKVQAGTLDVNAIDEQTIGEHLYTAGMPDPDLLIRTAGEMRVSNYLLWQISYAELFVTDVCWPDFTAAEFDRALADYARRERRFGGLIPGI
ncbi:MAG: isoprenyl transferase [Planctomycetia bacterium]|nr:isoprenyl transferase [Planctomycetia bacterium]